MSMFRSKKLDLGCFVNVKVLRDHTKRKVFAQNETQRYEGTSFHYQNSMTFFECTIDLRGLGLEV
jgi:hypothetical protein